MCSPLSEQQKALNAEKGAFYMSKEGRVPSKFKKKVVMMCIHANNKRILRICCAKSIRSTIKYRNNGYARYVPGL